ncbi:Pr6Pr family membrane protein [Actinoplanes oblitus]|uniref:Pr6Pr family membrane protein n=1 Tax=Actinoplanes oblitus TaxID=3040509 RepID=A0ABY8WMC1_9ACTN|nr:Pr6Pr family membrane protein [Actinoplanes oblitus]WIM99039.1 Pr6Pr family membrane protein [Actinoplanes oblitus]
MKSRIWHGTLAFIVLASLLTQIVLTATDTAPHAGPVVHEAAVTRFVRLFSYFTIQSNLLVLIATVALARDHGRDGRVWRVIRLDALLGIVITGIVYATILAGQVELHGAAYLANLGFHYIAPWVALLGWLLFGPRPRIDARTLAWASLWPALWIGYTLAHGAVTDWYPYPFTDVTTLGYARVLINLSMVVLIAAVLATALRLLDRRLPAGAPEAAAQAAPVVPRSRSGAESVSQRDT